MLYYLVGAIYVISCMLLLLVVLLQQGRGGDIASAFGGGGSTQTAFGARQGATVLTRATTVLGAIFVLGALALAVVGHRGPGSVVSGVKSAAPAPAPVQQPAPSSPAAPATTPGGTTTPQGQGTPGATPPGTPQPPTR